MAGLFGLFNYEKEGPGIAKDAPKKKSFIVFFETYFRNFWKFIPINIVYSLISMPLVTNGIANVGITNVARNTARDKHSFGLSDFFETIKKNLKQAIIAGIINVLVYAILIFDIIFFFNNEGAIATLSLGFSIFMIVIFTILNYYLWTLIITFKFSLKSAYKNSFKFVFINLKNNFICLFVNILILALCFAILWISPKYIFILLEILFFVLIYPCFNALLVQFCTFPSIKKYIIDPYYEEHPEADIEKRKNLGVYQEEASKEEEIFSDEEIIIEQEN